MRNWRLGFLHLEKNGNRGKIDNKTTFDMIKKKNRENKQTAFFIVCIFKSLSMKDNDLLEVQFSSFSFSIKTVKN